ncbi:MAG TPA: DegT/DnrJ/EryC1/StrS family aminotransferase [Pyrinomonadaceae bacterium]|jgi:dTDP-4-amino-4,6-dideoxygalactose transaminase
MIPFVDLKAQYQSIRGEVDAAIAEVLSDTQFVLGSHVEAFEEEFARYCRARYALGTNSGTSALHLALLAAGIGPGDEVVTVSFTFAATAAAIRYTGATPVFVDVDPRSLTLDPDKLEAAITERTKAVVPVHIYGQCADMGPILDTARRRGLVVIEDAAQAHGAEYEGRRAGSLGDIACFSFYPSKNLGAYGEAGAVVTDDENYREKIRVLRDQGQSRKYCHAVVGYNYRMEGLQGAVLGVKLRHLDQWNDARRRNAEAYRGLLKDSGVRLLEEMPYGRHVYHVFAVFTQRRNELQEYLKSAGVSTGIHYPIPVHLQPAYKDLGYAEGSLPVTERASRETLALPMYAELEEASLRHVARAVQEFGEKGVGARV